MSVEILPALKSLVEGWVVKKSTSAPPYKLTVDDLDALAKASVETLMQRALGTADGEWGSLEELTRGWIVQRQRGVTPGAISSDDFRQLVKFVLEGMTHENEAPLVHNNSGDSEVEDHDLSSYAPKTDDVLPDGRRVEDVLRDDPFYFAREHLALSL